MLFGIYLYFPKQLHFKTKISVHEVNIVKSPSAGENVGRLGVEGAAGVGSALGGCAAVQEREVKTQTWVDGTEEWSGACVLEPANQGSDLLFTSR